MVNLSASIAVTHGGEYKVMTCILPNLFPDERNIIIKYEAGEDKDAKLNLIMSYSYPYVAVNAATDKNTIFVTTNLLWDTNTTDYSDS